MFGKSLTLPQPDEALPGRADKMPVPERHFVNGNRLSPPFPAGMQQALFGMGCFWGAERKFWMLPGVYTTAVGYAAGITPNPSYREVCSALTGHNEVVLVVYDPAQVSYPALLKVFWEAHNPTQGMQQGNDVGTQYRSIILYTTKEQKQKAEAFIVGLNASAREGSPVITEVKPLEKFYEAEQEHRDYYEKNKNQPYCQLIIQPKLAKVQQKFATLLKSHSA